MKPLKKKKSSAEKSSLSVFDAMQHMMNQMWKRPFASWPFHHLDKSDWSSLPKMEMPRVNMSETKKELKVDIEVPGCEVKDIEVEIDHDILVVRARKQQEKEKKDDKKHYYYHESSHQEFSRAVPLPPHLDNKKAKSKVKNGVLTVTIPKTKNSKGKVNVKVS